MLFSDLISGNGLINVKEDAYGRTSPLTAYICDPARDPICQINGITAFDVDAKFNDISEIQFEVSRYITNATTLEVEENLAYNYLHSMCEIFIPELGKKAFFVINAEPTISAQSTRQESKSFVAQNYESILMYENILTMEINKGTDASLEVQYMEANNLQTLPHIKLYDENTPALSLLDILLKDDWYGWSIGYIDPAIAPLERSFEFSNKNVYGILKDDVCRAYRAVIDFDTVEKKINMYSVDTVGNDTNIFLSFANFIEQIGISPSSDEIYTVFRVAGADNLNIGQINFGSNDIINIDYPLSLLKNQDLMRRYNLYKEYRESRRDEYADYQKKREAALMKYNSVMNRQPEDEITYNWESTVYYSLEDLHQYLDNYTTLCDLIEEQYTKKRLTTDTSVQEGKKYYTKDGDNYTIVDNPTGDPSAQGWYEDYVDFDDLNTSTDAATYHSYKDVVIPDLEAEIEKRESGSDEPAESVEAEYVWDLYGLTDLKSKQAAMEEKLNAYVSSGYAGDYSQASSIDYEFWNKNHEDYFHLKEKFDELPAVIAERQALADSYMAEIENYLTQLSLIATDVSLTAHVIENRDILAEDGMAITTEDTGEAIESEADPDEAYGWFTAKEAAIITSLYRQSDYQNQNFLLTEYDDTVSAIEKARDLFEDAEKRLFIESQPRIAWSVGSADLFAIEEFKPLRNSLQLGDFIRLGFNNTATKLRVIGIRFSGLKTNVTFEITFSNMINTREGINDYETLLNDFITSRTNAISANVTSSASATASRVAASLIRPYIEIVNARLENAEIQNATISELDALWGKFGTLIADYLKVEEAEIKYADIELANVSMIQSRDGGTSWWNLETGEMCLGGYLVRSETEYTISTSATTPPDDTYTWVTEFPTSGSGEYVWQRAVLIDGAGVRHPGTPVCVEGVPGEGEDAVLARAHSSEGLILKNNSSPTTITVKVQKGALTIDNMDGLRRVFGNTAHIVWKVKQQLDADYTTVADDDPRLSQNGFAFTLTASDIVNSVDVVYEVWGD